MFSQVRIALTCFGASAANKSFCSSIFQIDSAMTSNSIHLEPAYGQFYTEYDPQVHQPNALPPPPPPQYEMDTPNSHKPSIR